MKKYTNDMMLTIIEAAIPGGSGKRLHGGEQTETLPGGGFHGGEQTETLPGGGFHGGEQIETLPGGGFHGGEQTETLPGGGFHGSRFYTEDLSEWEKKAIAAGEIPIPTVHDYSTREDELNLMPTEVFHGTRDAPPAEGYKWN